MDRLQEKIDLSAIRTDYLQNTLSEDSVNRNPIVQFHLWLDEAIQAAIKEPTAMVLSTVGSDNRPSARVVLLKEVDDAGFTFFTNYDSRKGKQITENQNVALTFFWKELERQVRIEGNSEKIDPSESDEYFHSRPYESRLSAASSPQSEKVADREYLERLKEEIRNKYTEADLPRPENWGGFRVKPCLIEFWQGRSNRLHDRVVYELQPDGVWQISRLAP